MNRKNYFLNLVVFLTLTFFVYSCNYVETLPPTYTNELGMTFRAVLMPVQFMMGSPDSEAIRDLRADEQRHKVELTRGIYVQTTEVTQSQWESIMGSNPSFNTSCGGDCPVDRVTWYEAVDFCNRLSEREGLTPAYTIVGEEVTWDRAAEGYRLPTEAEWEYVARAGIDNRALPNGDITVDLNSCEVDPNLDAIAWYCGNAGGSTHPVGLKSPNSSGFGMYDMHGNVWEWCWDWYFNIYEFDDPWIAVTDPTGPATSSSSYPTKVTRGGGISEKVHSCRSASRNSQRPNDRRETGLRVVRYMQPGP
jgi:formylglycine-generating enzyme required for sulfatase activity